MKQYFIIRFNDLKEEKQEEMKKSLRVIGKEITKNMGVKRVNNGIETLVDEGCDKSWVEWEVNIND